MTRSLSLRAAVLVGTLAGASLISGCAPLIIGGAMAGGALMATDRRSSGTQLEDQTIEIKARNRLREALGDRPDINITVTSYNRVLLLSGEVANDTLKTSAEQAVARIDNLRGVFNELAVMLPTPASTRSNDLLVTSKVKATLIDDASLQANAFKVTTERGIVYLMGRVTEAEATRAVDLTRTISGVSKVVRMVEVITDAELAELQPKRNAEPARAAPTRN